MSENTTSTPTTHRLRNNGAPFGPDGTLANDDPKATGGAGRAGCTCGEYSEDLQSGGERRSWHKEHKAQAEGTAKPSTGKSGSGTPAKPKAEPKYKTVEASENDLTVTYEGVRDFFNPLVRNGAARLAESLGILVALNANTRSIVVSVPADKQEIVNDGFQTVWDSARDAFKAWKKSDEDYKSRRAANLQDGYKAMLEYNQDFVSGVTLASQGKTPRGGSVGVKDGHKAASESPEIQALFQAVKAE